MKNFTSYLIGMAQGIFIIGVVLVMVMIGIGSFQWTALPVIIGFGFVQAGIYLFLIGMVVGCAKESFPEKN